jgi:hypothetical protein
MRRFGLFVAFLVVTTTCSPAGMSAVFALAAPADGIRRCSTAAQSRSGEILVRGQCYPTRQLSRGKSGPPTRVVYCGRPSARVNGLWNQECGAPRICVRIVNGVPRDIDVFATLTLVHHRWVRPRIWCPENGRPGVDLAALRDQAVRLLPAVQIGAAWSDVTLVNLETLLWAGTPIERDLAPVTVLGQQVALRVHFLRADWDFGDGSTDTVTTPGKEYDEATDPCRTPQCPHYYGHTYVRTGTVSITLAVTWHAQYRPDGGSWTDIPGEITGPADSHRLVVEQARGILVPNPGDQQPTE